jgi:uncharacterized protein
MALPCLTLGKDGVRLTLMVTPRSSRTEIVDILGDACKMRVKAPPVEGEANAAIVAFLAKLFGVPKSRVVIDRGAQGRHKALLIQGMTLDAVEERMLAVVAATEVKKARAGKEAKERE